MDPRSNPGHTLQIGRSQVIGAHWRRWVAGAAAPAAALHRSWPKSAARGGTSSGAWPGMIYEPRVIHLSAKIGEPELGMACASATAALWWRETTASSILLGSGAMV